MANELVLRPSYWASVSGGKDSLYMLNLILHNLDRYPLDGVVHFELEIDYPFIKDVIDYMESECKRFGIRFVRIKPRKTWEELFYKKHKDGCIYGFPNMVKRWCNSEYKLDCRRQLESFLKENNYYCVHYIGYCADKEKRYAKRGEKVKEVYPLVEFGINESEIWEWAKDQPLYNNYYKTNKRCGCMYCPMTNYIGFAYLLKYYPDKFDYMIEKMRETEKIRYEFYGKPFSCVSGNPKYNADYLDNIIRTKWLQKLNEAEEKETEIKMTIE